MSLYPVFIKLKSVPCLVIGGGDVAERKVAGLLLAEARITLISPMVTDKLRKIIVEGSIEHREREYRRGDLKGFSLVIAATDSSEVNRQIYDEARKENILINSVDSPENSSFFVPAVVRRGYLQIAISSSGHAPYFSKKLRQFFEEKLYEGLDSDLEAISNLRRAIIEQESENSGSKQRKFSRLLGPKIDEILRKIER